MGQPEAERERWEQLQELNALLDKPMVVLSLVWLALMVLDFTTGLSRALEALSYGIWALFALHFALGLLIAPAKGAYLRRHWLTAVALLLPAFRVLRLFRALRVLRAARAARSVTLLRLVTSLNRGMRAVNRAMGRRGAGYVAALTVVMTAAGAAGMAQFESPEALREAGHAGGAAGLATYPEALWWTAMVMTTMGTDYWPVTLEGRLLTLLLALYAFAVFGYITAAIASFFVGRDAAAQAPAGGTSQDSAALREEMAALRSQISALGASLAAGTAAGPGVRQAADESTP